MMTVSALLHSDEKAVARSVGVDSFMEQHALDLAEQLVHRGRGDARWRQGASRTSRTRLPPLTRSYL